MTAKMLKKLFLMLLLLVIFFACVSKLLDKKLPKDTPIILWWQEKLFPHVTKQGQENDIYEVTCPRTGVTCLTTQDRKIVHDTTNRLVGVIIYGTDFRAYEAPIPRKKNHLWALLHEESPQNNQLLCHGEALKTFNFSATFKRSSDFPLTTQHIPSLDYFQSRKPVSIEMKNKYRREGLAPAVYLQSNCQVPSDRDHYIIHLMENMSVDAYGACLHNKDFDDASLVDTDKMHDGKLYDVLAKYKFHMAFENAVCDDYITEKFSRPFHLGSVPVYFGSPSARDWSPQRDSVIMVSDFDSPASLARYLKYLDENDTAYQQLLEYKNNKPILNTLLRTTLLNRKWSTDGYDQDSFVGGYECYVCEQMHEMRRTLNGGGTLTPRNVPPEHLSCPPPAPSVGTIADIPPNNQLHRWIDDYWQSLDQAVALNDMLRDQVSDPESLWNYIELRYNAGQGYLQHSEL